MNLIKLSEHLWINVDKITNVVYDPGLNYYYVNFEDPELKTQLSEKEGKSLLYAIDTRVSSIKDYSC